MIPDPVPDVSEFDCTADYLLAQAHHSFAMKEHCIRQALDDPELEVVHKDAAAAWGKHMEFWLRDATGQVVFLKDGFLVNGEYAPRFRAREHRRVNVLGLSEVDEDAAAFAPPLGEWRL